MPQDAIELTAPDISRYAAGTDGIPYVHSFDSGRSGPHVMVNALTHGNEICGAIALDRILSLGLRPRQGRMTLAFVNVGAYRRFDPAKPHASRFVDEDFNRVWVESRLDGPEETAELKRARELRPIFDQVDFLLDIHSMGTRSTALMIAHGLEKERKLAREIGVPPWIVCGQGHIKGKRLIEYTPFNDRANAKTALLVECGQHWEANAARVALDTALRFLGVTGALDAETVTAHVHDRSPKPQTMVDVSGGYTARTDAFRFVKPFTGLEHFPKAGTPVAEDGGETVTTPHDDCYLVMPNHRAKKGDRALRFARPSA
jgi:predicted deacylase